MPEILDAPGRVSATQVRSLTQEATQAHERLREALDAFEDGLDISAWEKQNPLSCGCRNGWSLDFDHRAGVLTEDGKVRLLHRAFYRHTLEVHHVMRCDVALSEFAHEEAP